MTSHRRLALVAGALYLVTIVTSIVGFALKEPLLSGRSADATPVAWSAIAETVLALACIGTAVALYPITRTRDEPLALGFVASRILEAAIIATGIVATLALASTGLAPSTPTGGALVAMADWSFLLGPGVLPAVNAALLGTVLWRRRLVPRAIPALGLIGVPLLLAADVGVLFGAFDQASVPAALAALPIAAWEFLLGAWLVARGVRIDAAPAFAEQQEVMAPVPARP